MLFVDHNVAQRLELAQAWRGVHYALAQGTLRPEMQCKVEEIAGGFMLYAGAGSPLNRAVGFGMQTSISATDLEFVDHFYRSRGVSPRVDVCPLADPSLLNLLKLNGYRLERFYNMLVLPLADYSAPQALPSHIRVSKVAQTDATLWLHTVAQGFSESDVPPPDMLELLEPNFFSHEAICYLAWIDDQPAGAGAMYTHERVTEFGGASTRPIFRNRGVQSALLHARMAAAHELGCDLSIVVTTPGVDSQRNVERFGFRLAYTKAVVIK